VKPPALSLALLAVWRNPVLVKEIRTRMRGSRAFVLLSAHLLALGLALLAVYLILRSDISLLNNPQQRGTFGKLIFGLMVWLELIMVSFTAPALTSGAIALERERQTFDLLRVTLLEARALVLGKYLAGLVFVFLLLLTSLPLFSPAFILGGVLLEEILIAVLILAVSALAFLAVGLFFSSLTSRALVAAVLSYAFAILINFGAPILMAVILTLVSAVNTGGPGPSPQTLRLLYYLGWLAVSLTPLPTMIASEAALLDNQGPWLASLPLGNGQQLTMILPWVIYVVAYLLLSLILIWVSARRVGRAER
jgi:ABC-type transport system involved in multi-copper enzyme maturation permease subunit